MRIWRSEGAIGEESAAYKQRKTARRRDRCMEKLVDVYDDEYKK